MLDDKTLTERLRAVAGEQDHVVPDSVHGDLAAGRRRLVRRRLTIGIGGAAAVMVIGVSAVTLLPLPGAVDDSVPASSAASQASSPRQSTAGSGYSAVIEAVEKAVTVHLRPRAEDTISSNNSLNPDNLATAFGRSLRVQLNWTIKGQRGEGQVFVLLGDRGSVQGCGTYFASAGPVACQTRRLANGRPVQVQRRDTGQISVFYSRPDGTDVVVFVQPHHGNNNPVALKGLPVTIDQVVDLVQDPSLRLPKPTADEAARMTTRPLPVAKVLDAGTDRLGSAGTVLTTRGEQPPSFGYSFDWSRDRRIWRDSVHIGAVAPEVMGNCGVFVQATCETVELPTGLEVLVAENASGIEAQLPQPGGKGATTVLVQSGQGSTIAEMGITRQMVIDLVSDPELHLK